MIQLMGCKGCGSAIAEIFLKLGEIPYRREEVNYDVAGPDRDRLLVANPLCQVPTLIMPDGEVLTETLAIMNYVHKLKPSLGLVSDSLRFQRWSVFLISTIYPTFTYGDTPSKWLGSSGAGAEKALRESTDEHRKKMWLCLEREARAPYFLGSGFSGMDVYLSVMRNWRPGKNWFVENCPRLNACGEKVIAMPQLREVFALNFD